MRTLVLIGDVADHVGAGKRWVASHVFRMAENSSLPTRFACREGKMQSVLNRKKRVGRPKAAEGKRKIHNLTVRLSDVDLMSLDEKAKQAGLSFSRFLREAGLGRALPRPVPTINLQTCQELGRIGANLNQLLKRIYGGHFEGNALIKTLEELVQVIQIVRKELKGQ